MKLTEIVLLTSLLDGDLSKLEFPTQYQIEPPKLERTLIPERELIQKKLLGHIKKLVENPETTYFDELESATHFVGESNLDLTSLVYSNVGNDGDLSGDYLKVYPRKEGITSIGEKKPLCRIQIYGVRDEIVSFEISYDGEGADQNGCLWSLFNTNLAEYILRETTSN